MKIIIKPDVDEPWYVIDQCADAIGILLAMASARVLDAGQRLSVVEAMTRLEQVAGELSPGGLDP